MSIILILIASSLAVALVFLVAFVWAVKSGQYQDDYTPAHRMLFDSRARSATKEQAKTETHAS